MKKVGMLILWVQITVAGAAQENQVFTIANFDSQFLEYNPIQKEEVSDKNFEFALLVISQTKKDLQKKKNAYNVADYWNIATALSTLHETPENIEVAFLKASQSAGFCEYFKTFEGEKNHFNKDIPKRYALEKNKCTRNDNREERQFNSAEYAANYNLDEKLVTLIVKISNADRRYRNDDVEAHMFQQLELDRQNQVMIDSLYHSHNTYIGRSLVGKQLESTMWVVIQHATVAMMEKYLPIIQQAVSEQELNVTPLKMLIDRYYGMQYGYQIFGSQSGFGFELADDQKRKEIALKYGIE
tara:strand:- start:110745 stop:111641 length:897 start_codon:yes stop_codon:yes gene_type:complete